MALAPLISDLALILGLAAVVTLVFRRLKQPVILGYVLVGVIAGPHFPGPRVADVESIAVWGQLGVALLMFGLGLEFSLRKLVRIGPAAAITGIVGILGMTALGYSLANFMRWDHNSGLFLGCMIAISSTTVILRLFEDMGLHGRRFAETVTGVLIVEDIAAILILVGLSSFGRTSAIDVWGMGRAALQLVIVVGAWFLMGMILVPRFMKSVGRQGSNEALILAAVALCLGLVYVAAQFQYSVALGGFLMGSILAETREVKRIETLIEPLKHVFGAVFFISVGIVLDPAPIVQEWPTLIAIVVAIVAGKSMLVCCGALVSGQPLATSLRMGASMAQIGEFSFIIATLGVGMKILRPEVYPLIIAAAVITTAISPYLIRTVEWAAPIAVRRVPQTLLKFHTNYCGWLERRLTNPERGRHLYGFLARWSASAVMIIVIFVVSSRTVPAVLQNLGWAGVRASLFAAWGAAFVTSIPLIWAMAFTRDADDAEEMGGGSGRGPMKRLSLTGAIAGTALIGVLTQEFMEAEIAFALTIIALAGTLFLFRRHIEARYRWYEQQFLSGFSGPSNSKERLIRGLAPWNAQLVEVSVSTRSKVVGLSLADLQIREKYGVNIICVERGSTVIVPPLPTERLLPHDRLLIFGEDGDVVALQKELAPPADADPRTVGPDLAAFSMAVIPMSANHSLVGKSIRVSRMREDDSCIVVGIERNGERIRNPHSDTVIGSGDVLWVAGDSQRLKEIQGRLRTA